MKQPTVNATINSICNNYASKCNKSTVYETNLPVNETMQNYSFLNKTTVYETTKSEINSKWNNVKYIRILFQSTSVTCDFECRAYVYRMKKLSLIKNTISCHVFYKWCSTRVGKLKWILRQRCLCHISSAILF